MSILQANASVTHTYGNVACLAMDYIKKYFDDDFFKVTHISTKLGHRQLNIYRTKIEFWKLHKPILLMRPRIEMDDSSKYFYGSALMNRVHNVRSPMEFSNTVNLLKDIDRGTAIEFLWNRTKVYYDFVMIFDSYNEQLNICNYLLNMIVPNTPFPVATSLESYVPKHIVYAIADHVGIDRSNTAEILRYLNTMGNVPFTYKFKDGSGNEEFFALYNTNVETICSDFSIDDGSMKGMIADNFMISFTLSCEFNMMGCYYLFLRDADDRFHMSPPDDINKKGETVNIFTIPLLYDLNLEPGWKIYSAPSFFVKGELDSVPISEIITTDIKDIISYQRGMGLDESTFIRFRVFRDRIELEKDVDFMIDSEDVNDMTLHVKNCDGKATYRLFLLIHSDYIHSITAEMEDFYREK